MYGSGGLGTFFLIALISSGLLALVEVIKKKNPQAGESIEKVAQFGGYVGIAVFILAVINLLQLLRGFSFLLQFIPVTTIVLLGACASGIILGLFQSVDALKSWGVLNEEKAKGISDKLKGVSIPFGFLAVGCGLYGLLWSIIGWGF